MMRIRKHIAFILRIGLLLAPIALYLVHDYVLPEPWHTHSIAAFHGPGEAARDEQELRRALLEASSAVSPKLSPIGDFNIQVGFVLGSTPAASLLPLNWISKPAHHPPLFLINAVLRI